MNLKRTLGNVRTPGVIAAAACALTVLGAALSAWSSTGPESRANAERLARQTGGDLSDKTLARVIESRMNPAALAVARRQDPNVEKVSWGLTPGWETLMLGGKPTLGFDANSPEEAQRLNAVIPAMVDAIAAAKPLVLPQGPERQRAERCLTQAIYYEAALESREGQEAVAQVVLNRVRDPNYPRSVCGVVFQGAEMNTSCQFSFTCDGSLARTPAAWAWKQSADVAAKALNGYVATSVGTATHYHADYVMPYWSPTLTKLTQIGAHIFYRWRGHAGEAASFRQAWAGREPVIDEARFSRPRATSNIPSLIKAGATTVAAADGGARVMATLGGRRVAGKDEIARINEQLRQFEATNLPPATAKASPAGVTSMDVIEVGKPAPAPVSEASAG
jgi:spore germination cell wall hydrolase CwlJ-like protein